MTDSRLDDIEREYGRESDGGVAPSVATDVSNAARFAEQHEGEVLYIFGRSRFLVYDGVVWREDQGETLTMAKATAASIYAEAAELEDENQRKSLARWAMKSESGQRLREMIRLAQPDMVARPEEFDRNPILLNTPSGVVSLETGASFDHSPTLFMTRCTIPEYDSDALCPRWLAFLHQVMAGDVEMVNYLQRCVGYSLTGLNVEQVLFLLHGSGANGKSVFLNALHHVFGTYAQQADFSTFLTRRGDGPRTDLARLDGARLVTANESGDGRRLNEGLIKMLTGGDLIVARRLYESEFEFTPQFTLWLASNHKPEIKGTDHAVWRRIHLVPFTVTIAKDEQDPRLLDALKAEAAGLLRWAVEGCLAWQQHGLQPPRAVVAATEEYRSDSDILADFLSERCIVAPNARDTASNLYAAFKVWAVENGETAVSQRKFGQALKERQGITAVRGAGGRYVYHGVKVRGVNEVNDGEPFIGKPPLVIPHEEKVPEKGPEGSLRSLDYEREERLAIQDEAEG